MRRRLSRLGPQIGSLRCTALPLVHSAGGGAPLKIRHSVRRRFDDRLPAWENPRQ